MQQSAPGKYDAFDRWLFSDHKTTKPLARVREHAANLVGAAALNKAVASATVQQQLQQNIRVYELNSKNGGNSRMPQTIIKDQRDIRASRHRAPHSNLSSSRGLA